METTVQRLEDSRVSLEIEVETERFEKALQRAYRKVVQQVTVPGFRKGKAPRRVLEQRYGKGVLYEDALDIVLPDAYTDAVRETKIEPVDNPEFDIIELEDGKPLKFQAKVAVKPEVKLGTYKDLEVEKLVRAITDATVDEQLESLRQRQAEWVPVDRDEVQNGDQVTLDFEGYLDGKPFSGGAAKGYVLEVGSGSFIPGFEEQLVGLKKEDEATIEVTFPEQYQSEQLAGKDVEFKVVVHDVKQKEVPALDDEFAKDVSNFATLEELRADVRKGLEAQAEREATDRVENELVRLASEGSELEVPDPLVKRRAETLVRDFATRLIYQGVDIERYLESSGQSVEQMADEFRPRATEQVRGQLVLEAIGKAEGLEATDEEIEARIDELVEQEAGDRPAEQSRKHWSEEHRDDIRAQLLVEKALKSLVEYAKVTERVVENIDEELANRAGGAEGEPSQADADASSTEEGASSGGGAAEAGGDDGAPDAAASNVEESGSRSEK